jgi:hypothetical protein
MAKCEDVLFAVSVLAIAGGLYWVLTLKPSSRG